MFPEPLWLCIVSRTMQHILLCIILSHTVALLSALLEIVANQNTWTQLLPGNCGVTKYWLDHMYFYIESVTFGNFCAGMACPNTKACGFQACS
jgi:hypothetical protein